MDQTDHQREGSALQDFGILKNARKHELGPWGGLDCSGSLTANAGSGPWSRFEFLRH